MSEVKCESCWEEKGQCYCHVFILPSQPATPPPTPQKLETGERLGVVGMQAVDEAAAEYYRDGLSSYWLDEVREEVKKAFIEGIAHARAQQKPAESDVEAAEAHANDISPAWTDEFSGLLLIAKEKAFLAGCKHKEAQMLGEIAELKTQVAFLKGRVSEEITLVDKWFHLHKEALASKAAAVGALEEAKRRLNEARRMLGSECEYSTELKIQRDQLKVALEDTLSLAEQAMHESNNDGGMYDVDACLASAREALAQLKEKKE